MKIKPEELVENGYVLKDRLVHNDLIPFIQKYIRIRTRFSIFYYSSNIIFVAWIVFRLLQNYEAKEIAVSLALAYLCLGMGFAFLLVPIHEYLHVLAYKSQGAVQTSYDANLSSLSLISLLLMQRKMK